MVLKLQKHTIESSITLDINEKVEFNDDAKLISIYSNSNNCLFKVVLYNLEISTVLF